MRTSFVRSLLLALSAIGLAMAPARADAWSAATAAIAAERYADAIDLLKPLAKARHTAALDQLSHMHFYGEGTPVDYRKALLLSRLSARLGSADGASSIGRAYASGTGAPQGETKANAWFEIGAARGSLTSLVSLAHANLYGEGVPVDAAAGMDYLRRAADGGLARAQHAFGNLLTTGAFGLKPNPTEGARYLELAAEQGDISAQMAISVAYLFGTGVSRDDVQSAKWLWIAARQECPDIKEVLDAMILGLTTDQVTQAASLGQHWVENHVDAHPHGHDSSDECPGSAAGAEFPLEIPSSDAASSPD